jgi:hypothetical protein
MSDYLTPQQVDQIMGALLRPERARITDGTYNKPFNCQSITLDLTTAKLSTSPMKIAFPFTSIFVASATDTTVNVKMQLFGQDSMNSVFSMSKNDSFTMPFPVPEAYLSWPAQAGKSITIVFFVSGEFRPGSQISVINGGVSISEGSAVSLGGQVTLAAATAGIIAPALSTRNVAWIQNKTGADLYLGDSSITDGGATEGIKVPPDYIIQWRSTAALYGYSTAGGVVSRMEMA